METVVVLTKFIPSPAYSGGAMRDRAWIKFLNKHYNVIVLGFWDKKFGNSKLADLSSFTSEIHGVRFKRTKSSLIITAIKSIINGQAIVLQQYYNSDIQKTLDNIIKTKQVKFILCEELSTMQYVRKVNTVPVFFDDHNIEYELQERTASQTSFLYKPLYHREAFCVKRFEKWSWIKASLNFFVSSRDLDIATHSLSHSISSLLVENSFSADGITHLTSEEWYPDPCCVFVGNLSWKPNLHGLLHFFECIYPKVKQKVPTLKVFILGSSMPTELKVFCNATDVIHFENIDEEKKRQIISKCWLGLVPVYFGSGTRIKILEYWAHAKPVISTSIGAEGLMNSEGTIIIDDDSLMIETIVDLLSDKEKLELLGHNNYSVFKKTYEEETVYADSVYRAITTKLNE